ncbi:ATP-binding cassette domain-containing protein [Sulfidibacter corallicola]|uniref:Probable ATP-binding protein YbiT n=1 Tax=Sulfidibacter corallicola TaxID=2818388 RepID=A0A8A4TUR9_SULCO|nr:ATP-binding cassette domain-containing protein [Sulfidibacter corallicola]QTD52888.1 ATP-binding cassette domain-containing protein [Sulfidibacter corallicola]
MIQVSDLTLRYGSRVLFEDVNIKFTPGNCYGIIGANGAGKSTFLKILSGDIPTQSGDVHITPGERLAVLKQNHFEYNEFPVIDTVIMGHKKLYEVMKERDALYAKEDFTDEDGVRSGELEGEFADLNGYEAEAEAGSLLNGLGVTDALHTKKMADLEDTLKVRVLLAQALFGNPDILLLDEPTNHLDVASITWLENFLYEFENTVLVVSHDRHFLNKVCTHVADIDRAQIKLFVGNYDFWYKSSQLALAQIQDRNKKKEDKAKELKEFIARFSSNASKARQATARKKQLEKLNVEDIKPSSRKYPYIIFQPNREAGNELLYVEGLSKTVDGEQMLKDVTFRIHKGEKVTFTSSNGHAITTLFQILAGEIEPDAGEFKWGVTTSQAYFPKDHESYFDCKLNLVDWLRQYSEEQDASYIRGFLGRMLFSGDEAMKTAGVLSGGEKVRCMLSRMMMSGANVLMFDEPTNHLDLESITALNDGMIKFPGTVLFTSHDHELTQTVADRVIEIREEGIEDYVTTYDEYLERRESETVG